MERMHEIRNYAEYIALLTLLIKYIHFERIKENTAKFYNEFK